MGKRHDVIINDMHILFDKRSNCYRVAINRQASPHKYSIEMTGEGDGVSVLTITRIVDK